MLRLRIVCKLLAVIAQTLSLALFSSQSLVLLLSLLSLTRLCKTNFKFIILLIASANSLDEILGHLLFR